VFPGELRRAAAGRAQNLAVVEGEKPVQLRDPVRHLHRDVSLGLALREDQVLLHEVVERPKLRLVEVVLGDAHVRLAHARSLPRREARVRPAGVGALHDQLRGRSAVDRVVHLVLHRGEEVAGELHGRVVVDAGRVDVGDLLVEAPFTGPDLLDADEQFVEVPVPALGLLEALVVEHEALDDVLPDLLLRGILEQRADFPGSLTPREAERAAFSLARGADTRGAGGPSCPREPKSRLALPSG